MNCDRCKTPRAAVKRLRTFSGVTGQPITSEILCDEHRALEVWAQSRVKTGYRHTWADIA